MSNDLMSEIIAHRKVLEAAMQRYRLAISNPDDKEYTEARAAYLAAREKAKELMKQYFQLEGE